MMKQQQEVQQAVQQTEQRGKGQQGGEGEQGGKGEQGGISQSDQMRSTMALIGRLTANMTPTSYKGKGPEIAVLREQPPQEPIATQQLLAQTLLMVAPLAPTTALAQTPTVVPVVPAAPIRGTGKMEVQTE
jgi:hypothetical protein